MFPFNSDHTYAATEPARNSSSSPEMALSSGRHSVISATESWSPYEEEWASSDSSMSQDEIYDEIQRECAEIERKSASVSPASSKASSPQPSTSVLSVTSDTAINSGCLPDLHHQAEPPHANSTVPEARSQPQHRVRISLFVAFAGRSQARAEPPCRDEVSREEATRAREPLE